MTTHEHPTPSVQFGPNQGHYDLADISPSAARALLEMIPDEPTHREAADMVRCLRYIAGQIAQTPAYP